MYIMLFACHQIKFNPFSFIYIINNNIKLITNILNDFYINKILYKKK